MHSLKATLRDPLLVMVEKKLLCSLLSVPERESIVLDTVLRFGLDLKDSKLVLKLTEPCVFFTALPPTDYLTGPLTLASGLSNVVYVPWESLCVCVCV